MQQHRNNHIAVGMPSLVKIVRAGRPLFSAMVIGVWVCSRFILPLTNITTTTTVTGTSTCTTSAFSLQHFASLINNTSLLHLLVEWLDTLQRHLVLFVTQHYYSYCFAPQHQDNNSDTAPSLLPLQLLPDSLTVTAALNFCFLLLHDILGAILFVGMTRLVYCLYHVTGREWKDRIVTALFDWLTQHPHLLQSKLDHEADKARQSFDGIIHNNPNRVPTLVLPRTGRAHDEIVQELQSHAVQENQTWQSGKVTGTVYSDDDALRTLMHRVFAVYSSSNPLHIGYWPRLNECEGEVIAMTSHLLHAPDSIGCVTSGGTDSIVLAIRAHLGYYCGRRGGGGGGRYHITHPELICANTAHASVFKACEMFGIRCVMIDCQTRRHRRYSHQLDPHQVRRRITSNTFMVYASAPCYPQGVIDPIPELSDLCLEYGIGLHVDACLGAFILPFCPDAPVFDFRNAGVTSMSADTHKYGYASKGSSVVLYRHNDLRHCQYFSYPHWTGGMYATPTIAGSRSGAMSACAWAAMMAVGADGYQQRAQRIVQAARQMAAGIQAIPGLHLLLNEQHPPFMVVCFGSEEFNIYRVKDFMAEMEWGLATLQSPASLHMCITLNVVPKVNAFLEDLRKAVQRVRAEGNQQSTKGTAGIYGMAASLPPGPLDHVLHVITDMTMSP